MLSLKANLIYSHHININNALVKYRLATDKIQSCTIGYGVLAILLCYKEKTIFYAKANTPTSKAGNINKASNYMQ
jgi:hypothetical protein